jgi:ribose 5-phosphate isomerase B
MKISIGSDHRGYALKEYLKAQFSDIEWNDVGAYDENRSDYPFFSARVSEAILSGKTPFGILICGSGIGVSIAANRYKGIYAGLCLDARQPRRAYEHDGVNVLALSADLVSKESNKEIVAIMLEAWRSGAFKGGRYQERLDMIDFCKKN